MFFAVRSFNTVVATTTTKCFKINYSQSVVLDCTAAAGLYSLRNFSSSSIDQDAQIRISFSTLQFTGGTQCITHCGKNPEQEERAEVSQENTGLPTCCHTKVGGIIRSRYSECSAPQHGAFSFALPPQVKNLALPQRMHWDLWDPLPTTRFGKPPSQPQLHRGQTHCPLRCNWDT